MTGGEDVEEHRKPRKISIGLNFVTGTSQIQSRSGDYSTTKFNTNDQTHTHTKAKQSKENNI